VVAAEIKPARRWIVSGPREVGLFAGQDALQSLCVTAAQVELRRLGLAFDFALGFAFSF
jgi:hypothetical protein